MTHGRLLAAFVCAAVSSCLISPKHYPVGDIAASGGASDAGEGGSSTAGQTETGVGGTGVGGTTTGGAATDGTAGAPLTTAACDRSTWTAAAFAFATDKYGGPPSEVLDGSDQTRWTGGVPQSPGQWLQVDFGTPTRLVGLQLRCVQFPSDQPIAVTLELDGASVEATSAIVGPAIELTFAPVLAHSARIVLQTPSTTMVANMDPWWSMDELDGTCLMGGTGGTAAAQGGSGGGGAAEISQCLANHLALECAQVCDRQPACQGILNCFVQNNSDSTSACPGFDDTGYAYAQSAVTACCP
jgi:F5/8 type C domain